MGAIEPVSRFLGFLRAIALLAVGLLAAPPALPGNGSRVVPSPVPGVEEALLRLEAAAPGAVRVELAAATGVARMVAFEPGAPDVVAPANKSLEPRERARRFLDEFGGAFGIRDASRELHEAAARTAPDASHIEYRQVHQGVPVFGAVLRVHVEAQGRLRAANGTFVPDIVLDTDPRLTRLEAEAIALREIERETGADSGLLAAAGELFAFRAGLSRGVRGQDHLVYRVEVGNGADVREFVFVDAHKGFVVDRITGIHDAEGLERKAYVGGFGPANQVWSEGSSFPTGDADVNRMVPFTEDTFNVFSSLTGGTFLSWDSVGGTMHTVVAIPGMSCPNAFWNGTYTAFCRNVTADDTVGHEWGHAYTEATHNLVYQWQPGALNESYSDIWGEVVDLLNGTGSDAGGARSADGCVSGHGNSPPALDVTAPEEIAGTFLAAGAQFNPPPPRVAAGLVAEALDAGGTSVTDACEPLVGFPAGRIALVDRGTCTFTAKVLNAQNAGATGVIVVNLLGEGATTMTGSAPGINIPSVMVGLSDGQALRSHVGQGLEASLTLNVTTDTSMRWLSSEDSTAFGRAIRDLWNPRCLSDPGKVSDLEYQCSSGDSGGVHTNSGVPNHGFALTVDGGTYNGHSIAGMGLTRAANLYWRAQSVYQTPLTGFAEHADALALACQDLVGQPLYSPSADTAVPSAALETISATDCEELLEVIAAIELHEPPAQCNFVPMLAPDAPALCESIGTPIAFGATDWEAGLEGWTAGRRALVNPATFDTPDWEVVSELPDDRAGAGAFVADLRIGDCENDTEAGILFLESPELAVPLGAGPPRVAFDHWISSELRYDGGNVKLSRNGGAWALVPGAAFTFNAYPQTLLPSDNPMAPEPAFTGADGGSVDGSWGQSQINLAGLAAPGDTIRVRFEFGLDGCNGTLGWYVDEVRFYTCTCEGEAEGNRSRWFLDVDGDGYGIPGTSVESCAQPEGYVSSSADCNDGNPAVHPGARELCGDGVDNDCDVATADHGDLDTDGSSCNLDCDDANPQAWETPGEVRDVRFESADTLTWIEPVEPGGNDLGYDLLRSPNAGDFADAEAQCLATGASAAEALDAETPPPGGAWFYLVRARNSCPGIGLGTLGHASGGAERVGRSCP